MRVGRVNSTLAAGENTPARGGSAPVTAPCSSRRRTSSGLAIRQPRESSSTVEASAALALLADHAEEH
jgi:hypothetical protein